MPAATMSYRPFLRASTTYGVFLYRKRIGKPQKKLPSIAALDPLRMLFPTSITLTCPKVPIALISSLLEDFALGQVYPIIRSLLIFQIKGVPDVGKFVYRHVHSLHHKSYNPTAFSGTSMHPVEASLYYSVGILPALFGLHPSLALGCIADCAFGAWLGHDGFQVNERKIYRVFIKF